MESPDFIKVVEINHQKCIDLNHLWKAIGMPSLNNLLKRVKSIHLEIHKEKDKMGVLLKDGFSLISTLEDYLDYLKAWETIVLERKAIITVWIGETLCIDLNTIWKGLGFTSQKDLIEELTQMTIKIYSDNIHQGITLTDGMLLAKAREEVFEKSIVLYTAIRKRLKDRPFIGYFDPDEWMVFGY